MIDPNEDEEFEDDGYEDDEDEYDSDDESSDGEFDPYGVDVATEPIDEESLELG